MWFVALLWAFTVTLIGLAFAVLIGTSGGILDRRAIAWETYGGSGARFLWLMNPWIHIEAITFEHVIIARDAATATRLRAHEHVHVRQFARWGVLFPIAYAIASLAALLRGGCFYRDNRFEQEAFAAE